MVCRAEIYFKDFTATKALLTTGQEETIQKLEFVAAVLDVDNKTFVLHIAALKKPIIIAICLFCKA